MLSLFTVSRLWMAIKTLLYVKETAYFTSGNEYSNNGESAAGSRFRVCQIALLNSHFTKSNRFFRNRTIQANDFKINSSEINASIKKLNSALTKPDDLNLPRFRRQSRLFTFHESDEDLGEEDDIRTPIETPAPEETTQTTKRKFTRRTSRVQNRVWSSEEEEGVTPEIVRPTRPGRKSLTIQTPEETVEKASRRGRKPKTAEVVSELTYVKKGRKSAETIETPRASKRLSNVSEQKGERTKRRRKKDPESDAEADIPNSAKQSKVLPVIERTKRDRKSLVEDIGDSVDKYIEEDVEAYAKERSLKESIGYASIVQADDIDSAEEQLSTTSDEEFSDEEEPVEIIRKQYNTPKPKADTNRSSNATINLYDLDKYSSNLYTSVHDRKAPKAVKPLITLKSVLAVPSKKRDRTFESIVPLSKRKFNEKQKPLMVEALRIIVDSHDRRLKINTLDVLRQLFINFDPKIHKNRFINEQALHDEFKTHLLHSLSHIADAHASIKDISNDILSVQKQKNEFRKKIFDLKNNHAKVGDELNKLRAHYNETKSNFEISSALIDLFRKVSKRVSDGTDDELFTKEVEDAEGEVSTDAIDKNLATLARVINPQSGIYKKLTLVNDKLSQVDYEL